MTYRHLYNNPDIISVWPIPSADKPYFNILFKYQGMYCVGAFYYEHPVAQGTEKPNGYYTSGPDIKTALAKASSIHHQSPKEVPM